jgi:hypothetical protein
LLPSLEKYFLTTTLWARPIDHRTQVEMIPGHDHDIKIPRSVEDPIELRQRIMQLGHEKQSHDQSRVNLDRRQVLVEGAAIRVATYDRPHQGVSRSPRGSEENLGAHLQRSLASHAVRDAEDMTAGRQWSPAKVSFKYRLRPRRLTVGSLLPTQKRR